MYVSATENSCRALMMFPAIKIELVSTSTTEVVKNAHLSLTLHATGISSGVVDQAKSSVLSRGKPVGRWSDLLDPLRKVLGIVGGLGEVCFPTSFDTFFELTCVSGDGATCKDCPDVCSNGMRCKSYSLLGMVWCLTYSRLS